MNFHILTLFPDMIRAGLDTSIIGRAKDRELISFDIVNFREYTLEKHGHVDDAPFGGGAGMVLKCQPIYDAWKAVCERTGRKPRTVFTSPAGRVFNQKMAREYAKEEDLVILCGHYEGVDQRVLELIEAEEVSIGDYVLTGGELPAMVLVDAISRMVPGVLTNEASGEEESFSSYFPEKEFTKKIRKEVYGDLLVNSGKNSGSSSENTREQSVQLLEYPQYTRPEVFMGKRVPEVLLSGDHARVDAWRRKQSVEKTKRVRPDLLSS